MKDKKYNFKVGQVFQHNNGQYRVIGRGNIKDGWVILNTFEQVTCNVSNLRLEKQFDNSYYNFPKPPKVNSKRKNYEIF